MKSKVQLRQASFHFRSVEPGREYFFPQSFRYKVQKDSANKEFNRKPSNLRNGRTKIKKKEFYQYLSLSMRPGPYLDLSAAVITELTTSG